MHILQHKSNDILSVDQNIEEKIWKFFLDVMPKLELSQYLLNMLLVAIEINTFFIIFEGVGGNVKNRIFLLLEAMLGEYMVNVDPRMIMGKNKS